MRVALMYTLKIYIFFYEMFSHIVPNQKMKGGGEAARGWGPG